MSTQSEETESEARGSGFTVVFRLGSAKSNRSAMVVSKAKPKGRSFMRSLIETGKAEPVLGGKRAALDFDPILSKLYVMDAGDFGHTQEYLERLQSDVEVELAYVAPPRDVLVERSAQVARSRGSDDSWRKLIGLERAQQLPQWATNARVTIAVVDSGVDTRHPQLGHVSFVDHLKRPPRRPDVIGHGTHVAGLIAAAACEGNTFQGVANDCADVTVHRGIARPEDIGGYYRALRGAGGAQIINLSVGGEGEDPVETDIVRDCLEGGAIVVAAMGNARELGNPSIYPAALDGIIAVGAVDAAGNVAKFSNYGDHVLLAAPGVHILSTVPTYPVPGVRASGNPPLGAMSGTSMAAPIVTGINARMLAYNPQLTRAQVIDLIRTCLGGLLDQDIGHGILNANALLSAL